MAPDSRHRNRRKPVVCGLSSAVEACETRALLSAVVGSAEPSEIEVTPDAPAEENGPVSTLPDGCESPDDGTLPSELAVDENGKLGFADPEEFEYSTIDDLLEMVGTDELDAPPTEGWDPSWLYRTAGFGTLELSDESSDGAETEEMTEVPVAEDGDVINLEFDDSWILRNVVEIPQDDFVAEDTIVVDVVDPLPVDDQPDDGEFGIEVVDSGEPSADLQESPVAWDEPIIYFSMAASAASGSAEQQTVNDDDVPPAVSTPAMTESPTTSPAAAAPAVSAPLVSAPVVSAPLVSAPLVSAPLVSSVVPRATGRTRSGDAATDIGNPVAEKHEPGDVVTEPGRRQSASTRKPARGLSTLSVVRKSTADGDLGLQIPRVAALGKTGGVNSKAIDQFMSQYADDGFVG